MSIRFAILGSGGQLGRELAVRLGASAAALSHAQADLTRPETVRAALQSLRPEVVFNCAAYNLVDRAETEPDAAFAANAWGVRALAQICEELAIVLMHFSTDYVFGLDSARKTPYAPADAPGPLSVYGLSKLAGEYGVRWAGQRHFIVRTCGLYGARGAGGKGGNFVETMLRLASAGQSPRVVADQFCTPTYAADLAETAIQLAATERYGIHHLTSAGSSSWYEFATAIFELSGARSEVVPIRSSEWKAPARRPAYSLLECSAPLRPWREALIAYLAERNAQRS